MVTAIPIAGKYIVQWLWGGFTVSNPTLNRFFSIHFVLPFVIAGLSLAHLALLHKEGSNNPIGSDSAIDDIPFYPYFVSKDIFALACFLIFFSTFIFYFPNILNHPDNYIVRLHSYIKSFVERNSKINFINLKASKYSINPGVRIRKLLCSWAFMSPVSSPNDCRYAQKKVAHLWWVELISRAIRSYVSPLADYIYSYHSEINTKSRTPIRSFEEAIVNGGLYSRSKNLAIFIPWKINSKGHTTIKSKFSTIDKSTLQDNEHVYNLYTLVKKFDEKEKKFKNIFSLIYDKNNLIDAWHEIKNKSGNLTPGGTKETLDRLPLGWFDDISGNLKHGTHKYAPSRQHAIPKPGKSGKRFLTIGSPRDKIIQQAFLRVLQQIYEGLYTWVEADSKEHFRNFQDPHYEYGSMVKKTEIVDQKTKYYVRKWIVEPRFHKLSFGFRPNRSTHLALHKIKKTWRPTWFWSANLEKALYKIDHHILTRELKKNISDTRFINEIYKMLNVKILERKLPGFGPNVGVHPVNVLSPFLFNVYMNSLDAYIDELKALYTKKHELVPNPEFYKLLRKNRKKHLDKDFRTRIKLAKLFRDEAAKDNILPNLPRENPTNIYYVRYADNFLLGFDATKSIAKKLASLITNFIKSNLQLNCHNDCKLFHGRSELVSFLGFKIGLYPFKSSTKSNHITRFRKLKAMVKAKKVQEASLYLKMVQSISSQYHKRIIESCNKEGHNLLKISQIKKINDNRIKKRVINALKRSLSDIELEVESDPIGSDLKKSSNVNKKDSAFIRANYKRLNITRSIVQKWIVKAQELITQDNLKEINAALGEFLTPELEKARDNFLEVINKLETKAISEQTLENALKKAKSAKEKTAILGGITTTDYPIRILLPTSKLMEKLRNLGITHKIITRPKAKSSITHLKDHLIINWFQQKALGLWNYYCCADNIWDLKKIINWILRYSLLGTLGHKHKSSIKQVIAKYTLSPKITYNYEKDGKNQVGILAQYVTPSEVNKWKKSYNISSPSPSELENLLRLREVNLNNITCV